MSTHQPSRVAKGVPTGGQFATSARAESSVALIRTYPNGSPAPYTLLAEPESTVTPDGTKVINRLAEPVSDDDGIFAYGSTTPGRSRYPATPPYGDIPGEDTPFSGSVHPRHGEALMQFEGMARCAEEASDRHSRIVGPWAAKYDHRTSNARIHVPAEQSAQWDAERDARLAVGDGLTAAINRRRALPKVPVLPKTRRAVAEAEADLASSWSAYQETYPEWADGRTTD